jgi:signal transduction histidine kinase
VNGIPLRRRYFFGLVRFSALIMAACLLVLFAFNAVEYYEHRDQGREEAFESVALTLALLALTPWIVWLAWSTSRRLLWPLRDIVESAQRIRGGDLRHRVPVGGASDELAQLAQTINQAFDAYQSTLERLDRFSADVSHQLRTPLTALRGAGQVCLGKPRDEAEYRETIGEILEEVDRLSRVVDQLLLLARVGRAEPLSGAEAIDVSALTREAIEPFLPMLEDRGADWTLDLPAEPAPRILGNPWWLREAMGNVINNALRYAPDPLRLRVHTRVCGGELVWSVEDSGPGIPAALRGQVLESFQRGPAGHVADGGLGLGLAIVRDVARAHGGRVVIGDSPLGGASVELWLPLA